jgi:hypothetical protein
MMKNNHLGLGAGLSISLAGDFLSHSVAVIK